jgi:hypothetical protein
VVPETAIGDVAFELIGIGRALTDAVAIGTAPAKG